VLCCSENPTSVALLNEAALSHVKPDTIIVSIAPNSVLDLDALARCLKQHPAMQAVLDLDPIKRDHALFSLANARITPHIAFRTHETLQRRIDESIRLLADALAGRSLPLISPTQTA